MIPKAVQDSVSSSRLFAYDDFVMLETVQVYSFTEEIEES